MSETLSADGYVTRVNGPLVEIRGLQGVAMFEVVLVGESRLAAEVVSIQDGTVSAQVYEYTGGLRVGDPSVGTGAPLVARLGPGLLGSTRDGLLRSLSGGAAWLTPGALGDGTSATSIVEANEAGTPTRSTRSRPWSFEPVAAEGDEAGPGTRLGRIVGAGSVEHRLMVPPAVTSGRVDWIAEPGELTEDSPAAVIAGQEVALFESWPVRRPRPARSRKEDAIPLATGQRVLDLLYPVRLGGAAAVPGGFGTGKTVLLQQLAKWCSADVIVYVGCGERGNELVDAMSDLAQLTDPRTGSRLADRTVVIANTSNMPVMARQASIATGMTVAEYYRDMGHDVVLLADSTSRWAEALREFSSRSGQLPAEEGFPANLASEIAAFYQRGGRFETLGGDTASITVIGAVSPPGGDMSEPVTIHTERFVRSLWSLDRDLAYSRHYPAVSWQRSFSRDADVVGNWHVAEGRANWPHDRARVISLLGEGDRLASVAELVGLSALPDHERMVLLGARLVREAFLQQSALSENDATCSTAKQLALVELVLAVHDATIELATSGVSAATIEGFDLSDVVRARDEVGPDDAEGVQAISTTVLERLRAVS
ncbi:MAG TPA: V-type ATP synthase subunit A [Acidimicrobiales bacterium]|nr:V-type ATP synthase subunit A [Acidimicrobiales bacterium]